MPEYICPNCRGGFPEAENIPETGSMHCPWCGQAINGSYEYEPPRAISRVERKEDHSGGFLGIFK